MTKRYARPLTSTEIAALPDADIDFSEMPELDEAFWTQARLVQPDRTQSVTLRVKTSVLDAFKRQGRGYQTRMNAVLESYARTVLKSDECGGPYATLFSAPVFSWKSGPLKVRVTKPSRIR